MNKLTYNNNWEADEYSVDGKRIKDLYVVSINGQAHNIESRTVSVPYNDMGHTYNGTSAHYFVEAFVFGIAHQFDLNKLVGKVDIEAVMFNFAEG